MKVDPWAFQRWAFERTTGNSGRKAVLVALAVMADTNTGRCEALQETLAEQTECDVRTVGRHLADLEGKGFIARRHQYRHDGKRRGDEFLLVAPWVSEWPDGLPVKLPGGDITTGQSAQALHDKSNSDYTTKSTEQEQPPSELPLRNNHVGRPEPLGFAEWLDHHCQVTGQAPPGPSTKARVELGRKFGLLTGEGRPLDNMKLASIGAHADQWRRDNGKDFPRNVLVSEQIDELIEKGRRAQAKTTKGKQRMVRTKPGTPEDDEF